MSTKTLFTSTSSSKSFLYKAVLWLAIFTIGYNFMEGLISTYLGFEDESLSLFGFGADSFIEVISGFGILHLVLRIQKNNHTTRDSFERTALRITGFAFYTLVAGLTLTSFFNIWTGHKPETTFWGVIISIISIAVMWALVYGKINLGNKLSSDAIKADAGCTKVCIYMSVVLLVASGIYEFTHLPYIDSIGTLGIAYFAFKEGRECFEKANSDKICSSSCSC
ncbi:cation transporter [soil metagenome]